MKYIISISIFLLIFFSFKTFSVELEKSIILHIPESKLIEKLGSIPASQLTAEERESISSFRFAGDTLKVLVIPVEWNNRLGTISRETLDSLIFSYTVLEWLTRFPLNCSMMIHSLLIILGSHDSLFTY